ncbi:MAG: hypothetical protein ACXQTX_04380, partial [Candidatus Syntropharchaeia archaeon]
MINVSKIISSSKPEELEYPPPSEDHSGYIVYLTLKGHTKLAADHVLHKEMKGHLEETVGNVIRQLSVKFNQALMDKNREKNIILCSRAYETL